jgi:hypothetical protein
VNEKKPTPVIAERAGKTCAVCGQRSYSPGGIHPQCAMALADAPRKAQLLADKRAAALVKEAQTVLAKQEQASVRHSSAVPENHPN